MAGKIHVGITDKPIDIAAAHAFVADAGHGAVNSFVGVVRDKNMGRDVTGVSYDVFEPLAKKILRDLCEKVEGTHHKGKINIWLSHYKGRKVWCRRDQRRHCRVHDAPGREFLRLSRPHRGIEAQRADLEAGTLYGWRQRVDKGPRPLSA